MDTIFKPGFSVDIKLASPPGNVVVEIGYSEEPQQDTLSETEKVLRLLEEGANRGFFPMTGSTPLQTSLKISKIDMAAKTRQRFQLETTSLDARTFRVLLGMLAKIQADGHPIETVSIQSVGEAAASMGNDELLAGEEPFPPLADKIPFKLEWEEVSMDRVVQVEFARHPSDDKVEEVEKVFDLWNALLETGGYAADNDDIRRVAIYTGETYMLEEDVLEHTIDRYDTSERGFCALVNALAKLHLQKVSIKKVGIE